MGVVSCKVGTFGCSGWAGWLGSGFVSEVFGMEKRGWWGGAFCVLGLLLGGLGLFFGVRHVYEGCLW